MRQQWLASSYRTVDILTAFSQASAEADAIDVLLHAGASYCPEDDTRPRSRGLRLIVEVRRDIDRVMPALFDVLTSACRRRFGLSSEHGTSKASSSGVKRPSAAGPCPGELISHFAFPHDSDRAGSAGRALRARDDPA